MENFNEKDWVFERSSGYAGYRNKITMEWIYESEYNLRKFGNETAINTEHLLNNLNKLVNKFKLLSKSESIKKSIKIGDIYDGFYFDNEYVYFETYTVSLSSVKTHYTLSINWYDVNQPISYFEEYFAKNK